jgi:hypothetical protein
LHIFFSFFFSSLNYSSCVCVWFSQAEADGKLYGVYIVKDRL